MTNNTKTVKKSDTCLLGFWIANTDLKLIFLTVC